MSEIITSAVSHVSELPAPRMAIAIRPATMADIPFIDRLQKMHSKAVGFMHLKTLEGNISEGRILIAEQMQNAECRMQNEEKNEDTPAASSFSIHHSAFCIPAKPLGYVLGNDRYFKHDDVGIIYQMNIVPEAQRSFVGAALLKAQFERSAYGCKLYCCWCAKDLAANRFWESMGFVPLAFRAGSKAKERVHIFWQKRIRKGDVSTPWWYPSKTDGGAMREDRMVLPIPPGTHWSECEAPVFQTSEVRDQKSGNALASSSLTSDLRPLTSPRKRAVKKPAAPVVPQSTLGSTLRFGTVKPAVEKAKKEPKVKVKLDPRLKAAARELKDRWLEQVNGGMYLPEERGKYEVSRGIEGPQSTQERSGLLIEQMPIAA
jgi:hypothetical protein